MLGTKLNIILLSCRMCVLQRNAHKRMCDDDFSIIVPLLDFFSCYSSKFKRLLQSIRCTRSMNKQILYQMNVTEIIYWNRTWDSYLIESGSSRVIHHLNGDDDVDLTLHFRCFVCDDDAAIIMIQSVNFKIFLHIHPLLICQRNR